MDDRLDKYQESFRQMDGKIHVLEQRVPIEVQMDYFRRAKAWKELTEGCVKATDLLITTWLKLFRTEKDIEQKKLCIIRLASTRHPKAFTGLKELAQKCDDPELKNWICVAIVDIQMALESEMSGEKQIYVATGLGGKEEKLLFCLLFYSRTLTPFEPYQCDIIDREFRYILPKESCEVEKIEVGDIYVKAMVYIPFRENIRHCIGRAVDSCNEYGNFLSEHYTITNVKELDEEEIREAIALYKNDEEDNDTASN